MRKSELNEIISDIDFLIGYQTLKDRQKRLNELKQKWEKVFVKEND